MDVSPDATSLRFRPCPWSGAGRSAERVVERRGRTRRSCRSSPPARARHGGGGRCARVDVAQHEPLAVVLDPRRIAEVERDSGRRDGRRGAPSRGRRAGRWSRGARPRRGRRASRRSRRRPIQASGRAALHAGRGGSAGRGSPETDADGMQRGEVAGEVETALAQRLPEALAADVAGQALIAGRQRLCGGRKAAGHRRTRRGGGMGGQRASVSANGLWRLSQTTPGSWVRRF